MTIQHYNTCHSCGASISRAKHGDPDICPRCGESMTDDSPDISEMEEEFRQKMESDHPIPLINSEGDIEIKGVTLIPAGLRGDQRDRLHSHLQDREEVEVEKTGRDLAIHPKGMDYSYELHYADEGIVEIQWNRNGEYLDFATIDKIEVWKKQYKNQPYR